MGAHGVESLTTGELSLARYLSPAERADYFERLDKIYFKVSRLYGPHGPGTLFFRHLAQTGEIDEQLLESPDFDLLGH